MKKVNKNEDRFIEGFLCAVCALLRMEGKVTHPINELYNSSCAHLTIPDLKRKGIPESDLELLLEFSHELGIIPF